MTGRLTIVRPGLPQPAPMPGDEVISLDELRTWLLKGNVVGHLGRHTEGRLLVYRLESAGRPLPAGLALRVMARGQVYLEDTLGRRQPLSISTLTRWTGQVLCEPFRVSRLLRDVERVAAALEATPRPEPTPVDFKLSPLYLRTDLSFGVRAGGSVGHIAGVLNELGAFAGPPIFLTTDEISSVRPAVEVHLVAPREAFWNFKELPTFVLNEAFEEASSQVLGDRRVAFVYQRYSLNNYSGLRIARRRGVPFVLEYNGSELWMSRHWGRPLKYSDLSRRIEDLNLFGADLVVVVSSVMAEEITARGIDPACVLVNPNGVDPDRYRPDIDGESVRQQYLHSGPTKETARSGDIVVIGFIGTFGPWHGAEVLARGFVKLLSDYPTLAQSVRLMMIGDGITLPSVRRILADGDALKATVFTGLVEQEEGPRFLAACDVLVSPHVPNPDGTRFFGSPTKLFEYMAMGKSIIASNLDQIGEVLEHGRTALMVPPGDVDALASGLARLVADRSLRETLGQAARRAVLARHTWHQHTRRIVERLRDLTNDHIGRAELASESS